MQPYTNEQLVDGLLDHMLYLKIAHHVEGRIRVKASWSGAKKLSTVNDGELAQIIAEIPGIEEYRINKKALSVVIHYDAEVLPFALWEEVAALGEYPLLRERVKTRLLAVMNNGGDREETPGTGCFDVAQ
jgi:hypothetical protein